MLAGIVAGAEGRYATAATVFQQLMRGEDRMVAAHAAAAFAAHRRQLGGHGAALAFDGLAVTWATADLGKSGERDPDGLDAEGALVDGLLGLAADNLGVGRLGAARLLRAKAGRLLRADAPLRENPQVEAGPPLRAEDAPVSGPAEDERVETRRLLRAEGARGALAEAGAARPLQTEAAEGAPLSGLPEGGQLESARSPRVGAAEGAPAGEDGRTGADRLLRAKAGSAGWRGRVRAGWVAAEIELAAGNASAAVPSAEEAAEIAHERGAVRHGIKSDLVLAAALTGVGDSAGRERALDLVRNARMAAEKYEIRSLIWPAALIFADLVPANGQLYRSRADTVLHAVLLRADPGGRRLARESPWVPV
ncbi:hypothetical protein YIM_43780 [Amycolatopsis sp. YIM 10]|nr:hypothetical protein YIM_43780 [Amycolatopsis sp. YIM 10]